MKKSICRLLKSDIRAIRKAAIRESENELTEILTEHYPMLCRCLRQSASECRKIKNRNRDPRLFSGLFDKCLEMCRTGVLPDTDDVVKFLHGINGIEIDYLPLAITCSLLHICSEAVTENDADKLRSGIMSLQKIRETDFDYISEKLFSAEDILLSDPSGVYESVNSECKRRYRRKIATLAIKANKTEQQITQEMLKKSEKSKKHIGEFLFTTVKSKKIGLVLVVSEMLMPALVCLAAGILSGEWLISLLLYLPLWEIMRYFEEEAVLARINSEKLLSLDPNSKNVSDVKAMIVLSVILPVPDKTKEVKEKLENLYLSNGSKNVSVCCLADFKGADVPRKSEDKHIIKSLNKSIDELNKKYGGGFVAAVRPRSYSETQNEFIGKERKRGAIREFIRAVKGNSKGFISLHGDTDKLSETKYLIALDYDSRPVFNSVNKLIAVAEHPANKPVIKNGRVVSGYGVLIPEIKSSLSCLKSFFSNIMSRNHGISSYDERSSEKYQTLFAESIFCGKGLINVDAYYELLDKTLPKEKILSHDIIEGEILRTGFVSGVQIVEDFPDNADGYFKRQHRWIRGDWQNAGFIFGKNPLNIISRFKLFDNLRRSVNPVISVGTMLFTAFYGGYAGVAAAVISGLSLCSSDIAAGINSVIHLGFRSVTGLCYSKRLPEALGLFVKAFVSVAYSAREAFVSSDAIIRALWRVLISGNKLLEWTTSDAQKAEKNSELPLSCVPALIVSAVLFVFGLPIHRLFALIILADIPLTVFGKLPVSGKNKGLSSSQKEYLISQATAMWGYFEDLCGKDNNFLPPDNIQFAPRRAVANRTSPTNIGLMFASFLAARDFDFISSDELHDRLVAGIESVGKLEKYKGNLMNWYDTSTLETLSPRFVSSVDSGNFLCCLTTVKEGIREYENECQGLKSVAERIEKIISDTDLSVMYNRQRRLFHIGINPDSGEKSESCYDLYMSEIRMTAYYAVARKSVPQNHWGALDRPLIKNGRYTGLASWTGTMFEYFMADIFIPSPEGSLTDEALKFCLQCQMKKSGKNPFGMSESAFYAFDGDLNYQYKAHGAQKLGLKRGLNNDKVISPYSSYLTLNAAPKLSVNNLKRLEKLGMNGKYGLYEAVDYTEGRNSDGFSVINSFMVHHVGMSFLAIDNIINGKCMQKRFMSDRYMRGAATLLEEKPPQGKAVFKDVVSDKAMPLLRERTGRKRNEWYSPDKENPKFSMFFNGRMTLGIADTGIMQMYFDGENLISLKEISDCIETESRKYCFYESDTRVLTTNDSAEFRTEKNNAVMSMRMVLCRNDNCAVINYTVENKSKENNIEGTLKCCIPQNISNGFYTEYGFIGESCDDKKEIKIKVESGKKEKFVFVFAVADSEDEALNCYEKTKMLKSEFNRALNPFYKEPFVYALSEKYLLGMIKNEKKQLDSLAEIFGIKTDYPIISVRIDNCEYEKTLKSLIVLNKIMRNCGIKNTLAVYLGLSESEKTSALETIERIMHEESCDLMLGIGGGVYVFDGKLYKKSDFEKLKEKSEIFIDC